MGIILNLNDLKRLERRINKVTLEKQPPTLKMITLGPEDPEPKSIDQWTMCIKVEPKPENWGK
tara:strand:+ start:159 stop:347 length:189 start_codon:yes stop_codon:yes gene_type:complete